MAGFSLSKNVFKVAPMNKYIVPKRVITACLTPGFVEERAFLEMSISNFIFRLLKNI